jgi:hypothetical protein
MVGDAGHSVFQEKPVDTIAGKPAPTEGRFVSALDLFLPCAVDQLQPLKPECGHTEA